MPESIPSAFGTERTEIRIQPGEVESLRKKYNIPTNARLVRIEVRGGKLTEESTRQRIYKTETVAYAPSSIIPIIRTTEYVINQADSSVEIKHYVINPDGNVVIDPATVQKPEGPPSQPDGFSGRVTLDPVTKAPVLEYIEEVRETFRRPAGGMRAT